MTVSSTVNQTSYAGNGVTTLFAVPFYFLEASHLRVTLIDNATSVGIVQTLNVNYTVTGAGNQAGGSITMSAAPANGKTLLIVRVVPATQDTDYVSNDPFPAETHERALDKLTMICQQTTAEVSKSLRVQDYDPDPARLPGAAQRANLLLSFNSNGDPVVVAPVSGSATDLAINLAKQSPAGQEGTNIVGHINRTLYARLLEDASLLDFCTPAQITSAKAGDFAQDCTSAILAAATALNNGTIKSLKINDGCKFKTNDTAALLNLNGFRIYGKGEIRQFTANKRIFTLTTCTNGEISEVQLYGLGTDFTPLVDTGIGDGVYLIDCVGVKVHHCQLTNFGSAGIRTLDGSDLQFNHNIIVGTHGITSAIAPGDLYQFGIINQSRWPSDQGPHDFSGEANTIRNVAIGVRVEPKAKDYSYVGNDMADIRGNHGFYLNGQDFEILGNRFKRIEKVCIKAQSFHNATGPIVDPVLNAVISHNKGLTFESGISIERTGPLALKNENVTIANNNMRKTVTSVGAGIIVQATTGLLVEGNQTLGGRYGIQANEDVGTTDAVSGKIIGNHVRDTFGPGIFANTDQTLDINGNTVERPCTAVAAGPVDDAAIYVTGTTASEVIRLANNNLVVDGSGGVSVGLRAVNVILDVGPNSWELKPIAASGCTLRNRTPHADLTGMVTWGSAPSIANGASSVVLVTVTDAQVGDIVVYAGYADDLKGCTLNASVKTTNTVEAVIENQTGSTQNIAEAFVRVGVMRRLV